MKLVELFVLQWEMAESQKKFDFNEHNRLSLSMYQT